MTSIVLRGDIRKSEIRVNRVSNADPTLLVVAALRYARDSHFRARFRVTVWQRNALLSLSLSLSLYLTLSLSWSPVCTLAGER